MIAALGPPNGDVVRADGSRAMLYVYTHSQVRAATFIPIIGGFVGGADATTQTVSYEFDSHGILRSGSTGRLSVGMLQ